MITSDRPLSGGRRVARAAIVVASAFTIFALILLVGAIGTTLSDAGGWGPLAWVFYGFVVGIVAAILVLLLLGRKLGLGWSFGAVTIGVAALALLPLAGWVRVLLICAAPVLALLLTWPRTTAEAGQVTTSSTTKPRWGRAFVVAGLLFAVIGASVWWKEKGLLEYRINDIQASGVPVIGLPDNTDWHYDTIIALHGGADSPRTSYRLVGEDGVTIHVTMKLRDDSVPQPPETCSTDPQRSRACVETLPGVYQDAHGSNERMRFVPIDSAVVQVVLSHNHTDQVSAAELDEISATLELRDARWLAAQSSWLYRMIG